MTIDLLSRCRLAESGDVLVLAVLASPGVVGLGDAGDLLFGEVTECPSDERAELTGVDEERLFAAVPQLLATERAARLAAGHEPEADGDAGREEQLAGQGDHAIDEVVLNEGLADVALAARVGGHRAVRHDEPGDTVGGEVMDEVLDPGVVGVADRRRAVLPADILPASFAAPVGDVERRVGEDEVGLQIFVQIVVEGVGVLLAEVSLDAPKGQVHVGELPGRRVGLLAVDGDVGRLALVGLDESLGLHEHPTRAASGVIDPPLERLDHFDQELDDAAGRVELATQFAFSGGELAEEVLVDPPEDVLGPRLLVTEPDAGDQVDEFAEAFGGDATAGVVTG